MSTMMHAESGRLYSWCLDSHISPKNSKWLQKNFADMNTKVKAMIKVIEEDADSFARRAEMYYKKRPELMKLVEEFYRTFRALAERYDHAIGALRYAHGTMAEAFPNHIPLALLDESTYISSGNEVEPYSPGVPSPMRALFGLDDLQKDASSAPAYFHTVDRSGAYAEENESIAAKKGLKQLNEMFAPQQRTTHVNLLGGKLRKGLHFQEEDKNVSPSKIQVEPRTLLEQEVKEKEILRYEIKYFQENFSKISIENQNLKGQIVSKSKHLKLSKVEVQKMRDAMSKLESEKEAALLQNLLTWKSMPDLKTENFQAKDEIGKLYEEIVMGIFKLRNAEERCFALGKANQCQNLELEERKRALEEIKMLSVENQILLEKEIFQAKDEIRKLHEDIVMGTLKLGNAEERCLALEKANECQRSELEEKKRALKEIQMLSFENQNLLEKEVKEKDNARHEMRYLQGVLQLSVENQILSESKYLDASKIEVQNLGVAISKVESLQKLMIDTNSQLEQERLQHASNLEASRIEIEILKLKSSVQEAKQDKATSSAKHGQLVKDIKFNQVSNFNVLSRIQSVESEEQMLKLWDTAERDFNNLDSNLHDIEAVGEVKSEQPSSELIVENELPVEKLEISQEIKDSPAEWNRRVIERLSSDAEKLTSFQIIVQEFNAKMERSGKSKRQRSSEHDPMKMELKEAEEGITRLFDVNSKLRKKVEECSKLCNSEEMGSLVRWQVSEQAQTISKQIEKLELDLQKIYYFFLNLEEVKCKKNKTQSGDRVQLRDYIYGRGVEQGRKRGFLCGCFRPKTKD